MDDDDLVQDLVGYWHREGWFLEGAARDLIKKIKRQAREEVAVEIERHSEYFIPGLGETLKVGANIARNWERTHG